MQIEVTLFNPNTMERFIVGEYLTDPGLVGLTCLNNLAYNMAVTKDLESAWRYGELEVHLKIKFKDINQGEITNVKS